MKTIAILIALLLSGCSTASNPNLLKGELFHSEKKYPKRIVTHRIELDEDNIYSVEIQFR